MEINGVGVMSLLLQGIDAIWILRAHFSCMGF
jgi:hypothetical protein